MIILILSENIIKLNISEEWFPDATLESEGRYFVSACHDLSQAEQEEAKQKFADKLGARGLCTYKGNQICDIKHTGIICGRQVQRRRRRGIEVVLTSVDFDVEFQVS